MSTTKTTRQLGIERALHRYHKGYGFKSSTGLIFFRSYFCYFLRRKRSTYRVFLCKIQPRLIILALVINLHIGLAWLYFKN